MKGNNVVHLAASRGNLAFLEVSLPIMCKKSKKFREDVLQATNDRGKSCLDVSVYNTKIKTLLREHGAEHVAPRPDEWTDRLPEDHKCHRRDWYYESRPLAR